MFAVCIMDIKMSPSHKVPIIYYLKGILDLCVQGYLAHERAEYEQ